MSIGAMLSVQRLMRSVVALGIICTVWAMTALGIKIPLVLIIFDAAPG